MATTKDYLKIPFEAINTLIEMQNGIIDDNLFNQIMEFKKDIIKDCKLSNSIYDIMIVHTEEEEEEVLINKNNILIALIESQFEVFLSKCEFDF